MLSAVCHSQSSPVLEQNPLDLAGPEFQSELDVSSLLKLSTAEEHMKDDKEGEMCQCESSEHILLIVYSSEAQF